MFLLGLADFGMYYLFIYLFICLFIYCVQEKITVIKYINPTKDLMEMLVGKHKLNEESKRKVIQLRELIEKMLILDPAKRATVSHCLTHPFISEKMI